MNSVLTRTFFLSQLRASTGFSEPARVLSQPYQWPGSASTLRPSMNQDVPVAFPSLTSLLLDNPSLVSSSHIFTRVNLSLVDQENRLAFVDGIKPFIPLDQSEEQLDSYQMGSVLKIRRRKMNKHKAQKRRWKMRFLRRRLGKD